MTYAPQAIEPATPAAPARILAGVFRYVLHARRAAYEAAGWVWCADLGPTHGFYSILMRWAGAGEPVEPSKEGT